MKPQLKERAVAGAVHTCGCSGQGARISFNVTAGYVNPKLLGVGDCNGIRRVKLRHRMDVHVCVYVHMYICMISELPRPLCTQATFESALATEPGAQGSNVSSRYWSAAPAATWPFEAPLGAGGLRVTHTTMPQPHSVSPSRTFTCFSC